MQKNRIINYIKGMKCLRVNGEEGNIKIIRWKDNILSIVVNDKEPAFVCSLKEINMLPKESYKVRKRNKNDKGRIIQVGT